MSDFFDVLKKELGNDLASVACDGVVGDTNSFISTGSYWLNALISGSIRGGFPSNKIMLLEGEPSTGKSFFTMALIHDYLQQNAAAQVVFFESEGALTKQMFIDRKIDPSRVLVIPVSTVQEFRTQSVRVLDAYAAKKEKTGLMMVLDSLGMLSTQKEMEDAASGKEARDMTRAQVIRSTFRVVSLKLSSLDVPLIVTNHVSAQIGAYVPTNIGGGGKGPGYSASTVVSLSKSRDKDGTSVIGNIIKVTLTKSRFTREGLKCETKLSYERGLEPYFGLADIAVEAGIWKIEGHRIVLKDGSKVFQKAIYADPTKYFTDDVMDELDTFVSTIYKYGGPLKEVDNDTDNE